MGYSWDMPTGEKNLENQRDVRPTNDNGKNWLLWLSTPGGEIERGAVSNDRVNDQARSYGHEHSHDGLDRALQFFSRLFGAG